jgi:predicted DCC family thiol-disulfide oxidoreductase YuxK
MNNTDNIWFVYDGECPICTIGATFYKIRQSVGELHVVDARKEKQHPVMHEINAAGLDLDEGMVIKYRDRLYHGRDALLLMAKLGTDKGMFNKINNGLFQFEPLAKLAYPFMKLTRNVAITLKGVGKIKNLGS